MNTHEISDYIENLPLKKSLCMGYRPEKVYDVICNLSSMYNQILSEAFLENEELKRKLEYFKTPSDIVQESVPQEDTSVILKDKEVVKEPEERQKTALTDKELQKLKRRDLLEILLEQSRENDALMERLEEKDKIMADMQEKLECRAISISQAGTIAEASFKLNGVYEAVEKAAQQYLDNLKALHDKEQNTFGRKQKEVETKCAAMMQATQERCDFMKEDTAKRCDELERGVKTRCDEMLSQAEMQSKEIRCAAEAKRKEILSQAEARSSELISSAQQKSDEILSSIDAKCRERENAAEEKCRMLDKKAKDDVDKRWDELSKRLETFYNAHEGLRELMVTSKMV